MITKKKRGRPKKQTTGNTELDKDRVLLRIKELIDAPIAYEYLVNVKNIDKISDENSKIKAIMEMNELIQTITIQYSKETAQNTVNFFKISNEIQSLIFSYHSLVREQRELPESCTICREVEDMEEDGVFERDLNDDEEEQDEEEQEAEPPRGSRSAYLNLKDPISAFKEEGLRSLTESQKQILFEHSTQLFNAKTTYQKQIYLVIDLLYNNEKDHAGPTAIGRLFGIERGTVSSHITRMKQMKHEEVGRPPTLNKAESLVLFGFI